MFAYIPDLLQGLGTSLILTICSLCLALSLALLFTLCLSLKIAFLSPLIRLYVTIFTGTPLLIQFFLINYGPGQFPFIRENLPALWNILSSPWFCAILALTLNSAAYTTLLFMGAVRSIPAGQWQSCSALGMSKYQTMAILLPYAFKRAISSYSNEVILVFKGTSLAYTITLMDIMGYANKMIADNYDLMVLVNAGFIYLCINGILTLLMRYIEHRALSFEKR